MVDPDHTVARRRAHTRVGAAATATFLLFLVLGVWHKPASADPAPSAAPAATVTPQSTPDDQQPYRGRRGFRGGRGGGPGFGGPPGGGTIPLPDDQQPIPIPDDSGNGGQIS